MNKIYIDQGSTDQNRLIPDQALRSWDWIKAKKIENIGPIRTGPWIPDIDYVRYMYCKNNLRVYSNRSGHKLNCRWPISMSDNFMTIKTATFVNS